MKNLLYGVSGRRETPFTCSAVAFNGSTDYGTRGAGLTGAADNKTGLFSIWVKHDADNANERYFACADWSHLYREADNTFQHFANDSGGTTVNHVDTTGTLLIADGWNHICGSFNASGSLEHLYLNDVSDCNISTQNDLAVDWTKADWSIGGTIAGASLFDGDMAELYFTNEYLDLSIVANRRKLISAALKPMNIGGDGSKVTGTAPLVYCSVRPGNAASVFFTNKGSGGNFTDQGSIALAATSPSD